MHVLAKFHISNYFLQKATPKTKKKVGKWVFHENVEKSQKIEKIDFSIKHALLVRSAQGLVGPSSWKHFSSLRPEKTGCGPEKTGRGPEKQDMILILKFVRKQKTSSYKTAFRWGPLGHCAQAGLI